MEDDFLTLDDELSRPMDLDAVTGLATQVHAVMLEHIKRYCDEAGVLEVLNALAAVTATVLRAAEFNRRETEFIFLALTGCANAEPAGSVQ